MLERFDASTGNAAYSATAQPVRAGATAVVLVAFAAAAALFYWPGLAAAAAAWSREEYSYGYFVPLVAAYLFYRKLPRALQAAPHHLGAGAAVLAVAIVLGAIGHLSRIADLSGYGFVAALAGGLIFVFGLSTALRLWVPLAYLLFMLPLPQVVYLKLSACMQLISSALGVWLVRLLGIPVLLEGNVIDLGHYQLLIAEACSGLRYLFPLMSFGFLVAVIYRGPVWQKWLLFLSTAPITIVMNSVRIAVTSVLVTHFGTESAEGFLHFFQGWIIFLGCILLLFAEVVLLLRCTGRSGSLRQALDLRFEPSPNVFADATSHRARPLALGLAAGVLGLGYVALEAVGIGGEGRAVPMRHELVAFPSHFDGWQGQQDALPPDVLTVLAADDYFYANYGRRDGAGQPVNLFIAYYQDQTNGRAVHSPEVCLISAGWEIRSLETVGVAAPGRPDAFRVNRAVIQNGLSRALVYYWFEERGRTITNEYLAKWHILWDGITRNRTDGALVRLITPLRDDADVAHADARLVRFLATIAGRLPAFLPP